MFTSKIKLFLISGALLGVIFVVVILGLPVAITEYDRASENLDKLRAVNDVFLDVAYEVPRHFSNLEHWIYKSADEKSGFDAEVNLGRAERIGLLLRQINQRSADAEVRRMVADAQETLGYLGRFEHELMGHDKLKVRAYSQGMIRGELSIYQKQLDLTINQLRQRLRLLSSQSQNRLSHMLIEAKASTTYIFIVGVVLVLFLLYFEIAIIAQVVSKNQLESIMQAIGQLLFFVDLGGRIILTNQRARDVLGFSYEQLCTVTISDLFLSPTLDQISWTNILDKIRGREKEFECLLKVKDHTNLPVLISGNFLNSSAGHGTGLVLTVQDLTEMKSIQARLMQSEKMASLGTISAGVAHEINNPTSFIQANLATLKQYFESMARVIHECEKLEIFVSRQGNAQGNELVENLVKLKKHEDIDYVLRDGREALEDSLDGTQRIRDIVSGMRNFARSDDGVLENANLNEVMETAIRLVWNELRHKCTVDRKYGELPLVACLPRQISQVFMNLLLNAIQAMDVPGVISIQSFVDGGFAVMSVADTGKGILKEDQGRVFDPFFSTKAVGSGTGLGLSISYGIIKRHNGLIEFDSIPTQGTAFRIKLPILGTS